jgi:hypothetical protein
MMSYKKGMQAFLKKFKKKFPVGEYSYKENLEGWNPRHFYEDGNLDIYRGEDKICTISYSTYFGLRLLLSSKHLPNKYYPELEGTFHIYRRPMTVGHCNQHKMRMWLARKPKFRKLGANLASTIYKNLNKGCPMPFGTPKGA